MAAIGGIVLALFLVGPSPGEASQTPACSANPFFQPLHQAPLLTDLQSRLSTQTSWDTVLLPNPHADTLLYSLNAVAAIAPNDIWIVGFAYDNAGTNQSHTLTLHWDGKQWSIEPCLGTYTTNLEAVSAGSSNDVWAVGGFSTYHWDGSNWKEVPNSALTEYGEFHAVVAISQDDAWAVGSSQKPSGKESTHIEHWNGKQWSIVPSPNPSSGDNGPTSTGFNYLTAVAAVSSNDVWAAGTYRKNDGRYQALTLHWDGVRWNTITTPELPNHSYLTAITAISREDVWAVGNLTTDVSHGPNSPGSSLIMHWNGMQWRIVQSPISKLRTQLRGVAARSTNDVWVVGTIYDNIFPKSLTVHWDGRQWNVVPSPNPSHNANYLYGVAAAPPPASDVWAIGYAPMPSPQNALVLHTNYSPGMPHTGGSVSSESEQANLPAATLAVLAVAAGVLLRFVFRHNQVPNN